MEWEAQIEASSRSSISALPLQAKEAGCAWTSRKLRIAKGRTSPEAVLQTYWKSFLIQPEVVSVNFALFTWFVGDKEKLSLRLSSQTC